MAIKISWIKKEILILVKAYPERSSTYGSSICMAGITEDNNWIRLYPVQYDYFIKKLNFQKFTLISTEVKKSKEKLSRKESYKVRQKSIKIVNTDLADMKGKSVKQRKLIWQKRNAIVNNIMDISIRDLNDKWLTDKTSLGVIKPNLVGFNFRKPVSEIKIEKPKDLQKTIDGDTLLVADRIEHEISYKFKCSDDDCNCNKKKSKHHDITCEEWELFEALRKWDYPPKEKGSMIKDKFYKWMKNKRELYFFMGMYSLQPSWMIIGLYYPPKIKGLQIPNGQKSLADFIKKTKI